MTLLQWSWSERLVSVDVLTCTRLGGIPELMASQQFITWYHGLSHAGNVI